jgi:hypothetical protein
MICDSSALQSISVEVNLEGLNMITCSLDVRKFMNAKPGCSWISLMTYVDDSEPDEPSERWGDAYFHEH